MSIETTAGTLAPKKNSKYLPNKILRAIDSAAELQGLTSGVRATLQTICRYVSQHDPLGAVFTRRAKIAARAGLSVRSVDRHLDKLASLELVKIEDQRHGQRNGKFLVTHIFLTKKLAQMVGLIEAQDESTIDSPPPPIQARPSAKMACGYIKEVLSGPSSTKKQGRPQLSEPTIPADLQPLVQMGLMPTTVCKLMREARQAGKRLSDILTVVNTRMHELDLKGGQIRNYLLKAIAGTTDFAAEATKALAKARQAEQLQADRAVVEQFQTEYRGKVLHSPDCRETLYINSEGTFGQHHVGVRMALMPLQNRADVSQVLNKIATGRLVMARQSQQTLPTRADEPVVTVKARDVARQHLASARAMLKLGMNRPVVSLA